MIFRTGSILIVGKCNEDILTVIYRYICLILEKEYSLIQMGFIPSPQEEESKTGGGSGGGSGGGTRNTRKKKLNITNVQLYVESE